ncbi:HNH endonuclease [Lachnospiraceae bacterium KHCPX20]|nr:HNH endonuclease [Lachnospiraceae bacterium KHCPX20]
MGQVLVQVSDGVFDSTGKIYDNREDLQRMGLHFVASKTKPRYEITCDKSESDKIYDFCQQRGLSWIDFPIEWTRSADYRKKQFNKVKPATKAKYRCAYCGKKLPYEKIQVDHIFPVWGTMYIYRIRERAKKRGITNVNDPKNLCFACKRCNQKKGTDTGLWIKMAYIGQHEIYWRIRHGLILAFLGFMLYRISLIIMLTSTDAKLLEFLKYIWKPFLDQPLY